MSTRSWIAMENDDGTITANYCHFDGYLEHNGKILLNHYKDKETVKKLIALGELSSLGTKPYGVTWTSDYQSIPKDACTLGSTNVAPVSNVEQVPYEPLTYKFKNEKEMLSQADFCIEYIYLYKNGQWKVWDWVDNNPEQDVVKDDDNHGYVLSPSYNLKDAFKFVSLKPQAKDEFELILQNTQYSKLNEYEEIVSAKINKPSMKVSYELINIGGPNDGKIKKYEYQLNQKQFDKIMTYQMALSKPKKKGKVL